MLCFEYHGIDLALATKQAVSKLQVPDISLLVLVAASTACGLVDAHGAGYAWGDVKPRNLLLANGSVRLADAGSAARFGEPLTSASSVRVLFHTRFVADSSHVPHSTSTSTKSQRQQQGTTCFASLRVCRPSGSLKSSAPCKTPWIMRTSPPLLVGRWKSSLLHCGLLSLPLSQLLWHPSCMPGAVMKVSFSISALCLHSHVCTLH